MANALTDLYANQDALDQLITGYQSQVDLWQSRVDNDNTEMIAARSELSSAQSQLANDQNTLSDLLAQQAEAQSNEVKDYAAIDVVDEMIDSDEDSYDWWYGEWCYGGSDDAMDEMDAISEDIDALSSICDGLNDLLDEDTDAYNDLTSQVSDAQSQVQTDQAQVDSAQSRNDTASSYYNYDSKQLDDVRQNLETANEMKTENQTVIESDEEIFTTQYNWCNDNSSYDAWVANGRP